MKHPCSTPTRPATSRADTLRDWATTAVTFLLVVPLPALLLYAAYLMPGMP